MSTESISSRFTVVADRFFASRDKAFPVWQQMREKADSASDTRGRIFSASRKIFAQKGKSATVREICAAAQANVSAVNYYFGNKDKLLAAVLEQFMYEGLLLYPRDGLVPDDASPDERLFGFILSVMSGMLLSHGAEYLELNKLLLDGFLNEFPELEPVTDAGWEKMHDLTIPIVDDLSGNTLSLDAIERLSTGFFAQMFFYAQHIDDMLMEKEEPEFSIAEVIAISKHITAFAIGGIKHYSEFMNAEDVFPNLCRVDHCRRSGKLNSL
ncbi:MAG: TetR/AcrR family transcriptional regulator [Desulfovibrionales bacterium]|nr:TetR/AcrR family transcriptional regulator [Desulfovibrionales bacterium]